MVIELPPKVCRTKVVTKYIPTDYADDINEGILDFAQYGEAIYKPREIGKKSRVPTLSLFWQ